MSRMIRNLQQKDFYVWKSRIVSNIISMGSTKTIVLALLVILTTSLYSRNTAVTQLNSQNFDQIYKGIWLVQFYAQWCGHCKALAPEYEKAAQALKGIANIAAIDASKQRVNVDVKGYPTIKFFIDGKATDYNGQRTANGIIDYVLKEFKKIANKRLNGGSSGSSSSGGDSSSSTGSGDEKDVIILTDDSFDSSVLTDQAAWFVEFYAPWCGHCQRLTPEWAALATNLKGEVKVAKVDATENQQLASRFGVKGYPSIKFFPNGKKDEGSAIDYEGPRSEDAMAEWARQKTQDAKHFEHTYLSSQTVYDDLCKARNLCIISFLPHKLDSTEEQRQKYLEIVKQTGLKFRGKPFKFIWVQGGDQFELEEKLGVSGIGYPSVVAIFENKKVFGKLKRSFSEENLENFLNDILNNKAKFSKLYELPTLKTVEEQKAPEGCDETQCTGPAGEATEDEQFAKQL